MAARTGPVFSMERKGWIFVVADHALRVMRDDEIVAVLPLAPIANGKRTDLSRRYPKIAGRLAQYLENWEREHPKTPPTRRTECLSQAELDQLRALGYLP